MATSNQIDNPVVNNDPNNPVVNNGQGSGEPKPPLTQEEIDNEVNKRFASKEEELRNQIRQEIENEKNLTEAQKFELEKQKFIKEQEQWKEQKDKEIISLNTEKVKAVYVKAGFPNELVDSLVNEVSLDYAKEETRANNIIKQIKNYVDGLTKQLKQDLQNNQPNAKNGGGDNGGQDNKSYYDRFNKSPNQNSNQKEGLSKFFK